MDEPLRQEPAVVSAFALNMSSQGQQHPAAWLMHRLRTLGEAQPPDSRHCFGRRCERHQMRSAVQHKLTLSAPRRSDSCMEMSVKGARAY